MQLTNKRKEVHLKYNKIAKETCVADGLYKYVILPGNNAKLIERVMEAREHWTELQGTSTTLFDFKWCSDSKQIRYEILGRQTLVNHFEDHKYLS